MAGIPPLPTTAPCYSRVYCIWNTNTSKCVFDHGETVWQLVYSKADYETAPGVWRTVGSEPLRYGRIVHGSVLYSAGLRFMSYSNTSWKLGEPVVLRGHAPHQVIAGRAEPYSWGNRGTRVRG